MNVTIFQHDETRLKDGILAELAGGDKWEFRLLGLAPQIVRLGGDPQVVLV